MKLNQLAVTGLSLSLFFCLALATTGQSAQVSAPYASARALSAPEVFGEGVISTGDDESHPEFTPDGKTIYFLKNTPTFSHWTIVESHYKNNRWTTPEVAPFSGQYSDADPFITPDGQKFFFISTRPVEGDKERDDTDMWMMERAGAKWGEPKHLGPLVNSAGSEWFPTVTSDGTLYFGSDRQGSKGRTDIWRAKFADGKYGEPENLGDAINTAANEVEPYVAYDGSYMIFAAVRPEGKGAYDLYVSYNRGGAWTKAESLGEKINSSGWDFSPKVSPDGKYFFFTSNRGFTDQPLGKRLSYRELTDKLHSPRNGLRDIYQMDFAALGLSR